MKQKAKEVFWIPGNHDPFDFHVNDIQFEDSLCV